MIQACVCVDVCVGACVCVCVCIWYVQGNLSIVVTMEIVALIWIGGCWKCHSQSIRVTGTRSGDHNGLKHTSSPRRESLEA